MVKKLYASLILGLSIIFCMDSCAGLGCRTLPAVAGQMRCRPLGGPVTATAHKIPPVCQD